MRDESQRQEVRRFLNKKFIEWRREQPGRKAGVVHFADWLGVSRNVVNGCLTSGTVPDKENLDRMAAKIGDELYRVCGVEPPDARLRAIAAHWQYITEENKTAWAQFAERAAAPYEVEKERRNESIKGDH